MKLSLKFCNIFDKIQIYIVNINIIWQNEYLELKNEKEWAKND